LFVVFKKFLVFLLPNFFFKENPKMVFSGAPSCGLSNAPGFEPFGALLAGQSISNVHFLPFFPVFGLFLLQFFLLFPAFADEP
jgi:hypothetical protein